MLGEGKRYVRRRDDRGLWLMLFVIKDRRGLYNAGV